MNFRDLKDIKESEARAQSQIEILKNALDDHSLELRVKAATEAEAACQQRLSIAEAEITELRTKLDTSERLVKEETFVYIIVLCYGEVGKDSSFISFSYY